MCQSVCVCVCVCVCASLSVVSNSLHQSLVMSSSSPGSEGEGQATPPRATCGLVTGEQEVSSGLGGQFQSMGEGLSAGVLQEVEPHLNEVRLFSPVVPGTLPPNPCRLPLLPAAQHPSEGHGREPGLATSVPPQAPPVTRATSSGRQPRNPSLLSGVLGTGLPGLGTEHLPGALCSGTGSPALGLCSP